MSAPTGNPLCLAISIRDPRNELVGPECENLTDGIPDVYGVSRCTRIDRIPFASYTRTGLNLIAEAPGVDELIAKVDQSSFESEGFRVELARLSKDVHIDRWDVMRRVADAIPTDPDMQAPRHRFLVLVRKDWCAVGEIISEQTHDYRIHDGKPWRTSSSLPSQLARALVNMVVPGSKTIGDPCCGVGSLLLEGVRLGYRVIGVDRNRKMVSMSRQNMAHFGYDGYVGRGDGRQWDECVDAIVTDLPYGNKLRMSEPDARCIMDRSAECAPLAVIVAGGDVSDWLLSAGYTCVRVFRVPKQTGFQRFIHRAERS